MWSPMSSQAHRHRAMASHLRAFYFMWNGLLVCLEATSLWSFSLWPACVEEKLDARLTVKAPSAQKTIYFPFWKIKLHEDSCISNLFSVESYYDQLSMQSASLLSFFLGIAFGKKKWLCISIPLLRLIIELNMTALNGFGLNMSPWGVPLVTGFVQLFIAALWAWKSSQVSVYSAV